jgi:transcription elongation GreA/GreB family factor
VTIGSVVEVEDLASGKRREHLLTGGYEPQGPNDVSANSPVGQALLGRVIGDEVALKLPNGREQTLKISAVRA